MEAAGCIAPATGQIQSPKRPVRTEWFAKAAGMDGYALTHELRRRTILYDEQRHGPKKRRRR